MKTLQIYLVGLFYYYLPHDTVVRERGYCELMYCIITTHFEKYPAYLILSLIIIFKTLFWSYLVLSQKFS